MNYQLMEQLNQLRGDATLYFKDRLFQTDQLDLVSFQVISDFLKDCDKKKKGDAYYELLRCWYYALLRIKEEEQEITPRKLENNEQEDAFYEAFLHRTNVLSKEEKITLLYRLPWHLRTLLIASTGEYLVEDFIHNVATMHKVEELNFGDLSYMAISPYDRWAIRTIQDDLSLQHEEKLTYQLTKNLPLIPYVLEHFETFLKKEGDGIKQQDQHGLDILAFLLDIYKEEERTLTAFQFVLFALSSMCFWHFETTVIDTKWFIKQGKFKHLKRIREYLRKNR